MVNSALSQPELPPTISGEEFARESDPRNITARSKTGGLIPMEFLTGLKPVVRYLRILGSEAWIHVFKNPRTKLHTKATRSFGGTFSDQCPLVSIRFRI